MLKPAQLYADELKKKEIESWYDPKNIYYNGWTGAEITKLPNHNYDSHNFVSVDKKDNVIGYISYNINWLSFSADKFGIISFDKGNLEFVKDVYKVICDLFEKYNMNRISWCCYADNPAIRGYRNFIKKHGGRECGYRRQQSRLMDGKLHDSVEFEILAREFKRQINMGNCNTCLYNSQEFCAIHRTIPIGCNDYISINDKEHLKEDNEWNFCKELTNFKKEIILRLIKTIEKEFDSWGGDTTYRCEDGTIIDTDAGFVYEWFQEYKEVLKRRYGIEQEEKE